MTVASYPGCGIRERERGAYASDKNTSAVLCAKNAGGGLMREGGVFAGHYGTYKYNLRLKTPLVPDAPAQL